MIDKSKVILITAILFVSFASPGLADCLESGAAESCGGGSQGFSGGVYGQDYGYAPRVRLHHAVRRHGRGRFR